MKPKIELNNLEIMNYREPEFFLERDDFQVSKIFENENQRNLLKE